MRWRLETHDRIQEPATGLVFDLASDVFLPDGTVQQVITLNIAEADDSKRENRRTAMGEAYRTPVCHFRHEIGHFYCDRLVRNAGEISSFREVFGDESENYGQALSRHYQNGAPPQLASVVHQRLCDNASMGRFC